MALSKQIALPNGVRVNYHRVVRVDTFVNVQNAIEVASYTSRAKREEEREALASEDPTMDVYIETGIYEAPYDPLMTPEAAYEWLKANRPEFEGAADVLEDDRGEEVA